jgi:hypothetical protein
VPGQGWRLASGRSLNGRNPAFAAAAFLGFFEAEAGTDLEPLHGFAEVALTSGGETGEGGDGGDRADFVVGGHDDNHASAVMERVGHSVEVDLTNMIDREPLHLG